MRKVFVYLVASLLSLFPQMAFAAKPTPTPTPSAVHTVCVDAGHGGSDTGAVYKDITEAQENLDIAQRLEALLTTAGYTVVMTRSDMATTLSNSQRAAICNTAHADVLVSVHLNASTDHTIDYTIGLYGKQTKDKIWARKVNTAMSALGITNNGITNYADGMLLKATMPATLAETVFLSSDTEYSLLTDGTGNRQQEIAQALFNGITSQ